MDKNSLKRKRKQGYFFEKKMVSKFRKNCDLTYWTSDKRCGCIFAPHSEDPDLGMQLKGQPEHRFAIECKWHYLADTLDCIWVAANNTQLERYRNYQKDNHIPVFIAVGLGEIGCDLQALYIIPLDEINNWEMMIKDIDQKYEFNIQKDLRYNPETKLIEEV